MSQINQVYLKNEWINRKIPIVNGIIYQDGSVDCIEISYVGKSRSIQHGNKIHLDDLLSKNELGFSSVMIANKLEDFHNNINVYYGEGSFGGDGFVLVESSNDFQIKWIAFFENANPFEKVEIKNNLIYAHNNLKEIWKFELNNPSKLTIT